MRRLWLLSVVAALSLAAGACAPKGTSEEKSLPDVACAVDNPLLGYWFSPQDSMVSQLYFTEDTLYFTELIMGYPYYTKGDSLIVTGSDGDVFIRWRYVLQPDTLRLFQRPQDSPEEYMVLLVGCRE